MRTLSQVLTAAQKWPLNIAGTYFEVLGLSGNVGINVSFLRGQSEITNAYMQDVLAGTYAIPEGGFDTIVVDSPVAQTVKIAIAAGQGGSRRIAGEVSVIDGAIARSVAGQAFVARINLAASPGNYSHVQLWNPPGSAKKLIVNQFGIASGTLQGVYLNRHNAALTNAYATLNPLSKLTSGVASVAEQRTVANAAVLGSTWQVLNVAASISLLERLTDPYVIEAGQGLVFCGSTVNSDVSVHVHFNEQL